MRILTSMLVILILAALPVIAGNDAAENALFQEMLAEKALESGLSLNGSSGLFLTTGTEGLTQGSLLVGVGGSLSNFAGSELGMNVSVALGVMDSLLGFENIEISAAFPYYIDDLEDSENSGLGNATITVKAQWLEEDPLSPDIPAVSFLASAVLPGDDDFSNLDMGGVEVGMILGTRVPDSSGSVDFRVYFELRYSYFDYKPDTQDQFWKWCLGISFPVTEVPNLYLLLEGGGTRDNGNSEDNTQYAMFLRYQEQNYNLSVGMHYFQFDDLDINMQRFQVMYDFKF